MATEKQITANRTNAQKSSGPKTPEGRAKSSMNRLSWGFCSNTILMPGEDPREFESLLEDLIAHHQPANVTEQILVEKMAQNKWLSDRAFRLQSESFIDSMIRGEKFAIPKDLSLLIRYRTAAENSFHKAHNQLVKAQKERAKSEIGFVPEAPRDEPQNAHKIVPVTLGQEPCQPLPHLTDEEILAEVLAFEDYETENAA